MSSIDFNALTSAQQETLLDGPALQPPTGVIPNFDNPPNLNAMANTIYSCCFVVGSLFFFTRVYSTWFCMKRAHISDYILVVAYCFYAAFVAVILRQVHVGYFVHQWNFRLRDVPDMFYVSFKGCVRLFYSLSKLFILATNLFAVTIMLIKAAILLEWLRIFVAPGTRNYFYWITVVLLCIDFLFYSAAIISVNLTCIPHAKIWNRLLPGKCIDSKSVDITSAVINFVIDVVALILPQKVIWGLNMPFEKRLGVSAIFIVGFTACFAAGYRLAVTISYSRSQDVTYTFCTVGIWVVVETTCGLIILCTPTLPKALANMGVVKLYTVLKSWTRQTTTGRSDVELDSSSGANNPYTKRPKSRQYDKLAGQHVTLPSTFELSQVALVGPDTARNKPNRPIAHGDSAISQTTHISITTSKDSQHEIPGTRMPIQYPWDLENV